jgi:alpha-L-rhamnosidase
MAHIDGPIRIEHLRDPLGIGTAAPRLSWRTAAPDEWRQAAYEIELRRGSDEPLTALVRSVDQVLVPWPFPPLTSRDQVALRIRLHGEDGATGEWSAPTDLETGLLQPSDWFAAPVSGSWSEEVGTDRRPSRVRRRFRVDAPITSARLHATAHGVFEAEINGTRVGDDVLAPGWTSYTSRLRYRTYDVTALLTEGDNMIGAWLGDGWYRGRLGFNGGYHDLYGTDLSFIGQLEITLADGTIQRIATDASWEVQPEPHHLQRPLRRRTLRPAPRRTHVVDARSGRRGMDARRCRHP